MAQFKVYQISLTDSDSDYVNDNGWTEAANNEPRIQAYLDASFGRVKSDSYHKHVATITAATLDEVFHIGNMGPEENIDRVAQMRSVSVGDIIEASDGTKHIVAHVGFDQLAAWAREPK